MSGGDLKMLLLVWSMVLVPIPWVVICLILANRYIFPYFVVNFDVSGKRMPEMGDYIDNWLIENGLEAILEHLSKVEKWKAESLAHAQSSLLRRRRMRQLNFVMDDKPFRFSFVRARTAYTQQNYVRTPHTIRVCTDTFCCDYAYLRDRYNQLEEIGFQGPLRLNHAKNQRKLATRQLRESIMRRDNYTCQICGKYMPDEVGLQIDHIVPVSKGGMTVEWNLRVLCSKCNGAKSDKII